MSTSVSRAGKSKPKTLLALLTTFLVALSGLFVVPAATAAEGPSVSVSVAPRTGGEVTVTGAGFDPAGVGIYLGLAESSFSNFYEASPEDTSWISATSHSLNADGTFSVQMTVPAYEEGIEYAFFTSKAHGQGVGDPSQNTKTLLTYEAAPAVETSIALSSSLAEVEAGDSVTLTANVSPADASGSVQFYNGETPVGEAQGVSGGSASVNTGALVAGMHSFTAAFLPADTDVFVASSSATVSVVATEEEALAEPEKELEASPVTGTDDAGLTWAFKDSWNTYVHSPWTMGKLIVSDGATRGENDVIGFASDSNDLNVATGYGTIKYTGTVRWVSDAHGFDITMSNPWVIIDAEGTRISAEVSEVKAAGNPGTSRIIVATLDDPSSTDAEGVRSWTNQATTLANLTQPKGGWERYAGNEGAPVSFSVAVPQETVWSPSITVYEADGVTPLDENTPVYDGDKIVIKGSGFDPEANIGGGGMPIPNTLPQGSYIVFGNFAEEWQPSVGVDSTQRAVGSQAWVLSKSVLDQVPANFQGAIKAQWAELAEDGTFEATLTVGPPTNRNGTPATLPENGIYGVYSYGAAGVVNADQELGVAVNYQGERPTEWTPAIEVFMADGVTPYTNQEVSEGDKLVVKGTGFDPESNIGTNLNSPIPAGQPQGTFIVFGNFAAEWKPSEGNSSTSRFMHKDARQWAVSDAVFDALENPASIADSRDVLAEDGSFTTTVTLKAPTAEQVLPANGQWGIYTYAGGVGTVNAAQEIGVAINFASEDSDDSDEEEQAAGSLFWGVKESFVNYISSAGKVTVTEPAGRDGNIFGFPLSSTDAWDAETETGSLAYSGEVNFFAHGGVLNITLTNPIIEVLNENEALLKVEYEGALKTIATVDLSVAQRTANEDGSVTWADATVIATSGTTHIFGSNYPAGTELAPATFTAGAVSEEPIEGGETPSEPEEDTETQVVAPPTSEPAEQCVARAVVGGSMTWGFKSSFVNYVNGPIAKGKFTNTGFSASSGALNPENGGIGIANFGGSVNGTGHGGVLNYTVSNPSIQITGPSTGILYATAGGSRVAYANLAFSSLNVGANSVSGNASVTLTAAGSATLGDYADMYGPSTAMDPLSFSVSLGGEVECDSSTDPVLLAATGTPEQGTAAMINIALVLMLIGAGLVSARRRGAFAQR